MVYELHNPASARSAGPTLSLSSGKNPTFGFNEAALGLLGIVRPVTYVNIYVDRLTFGIAIEVNNEGRSRITTRNGDRGNARRGSLAGALLVRNFNLPPGRKWSLSLDPANGFIIGTLVPDFQAVPRPGGEVVNNPARTFLA